MAGWILPFPGLLHFPIGSRQTHWRASRQWHPAWETTDEQRNDKRAMQNDTGGLREPVMH
jgi:hypothetical protein